MTIWKLASRLLWNVVAVGTVAVLLGGFVAVGTWQAARLGVDVLRVMVRA